MLSASPWKMFQNCPLNGIAFSECRMASESGGKSQKSENTEPLNTCLKKATMCICTCRRRVSFFLNKEHCKLQVNAYDSMLTVSYRHTRVACLRSTSVHANEGPPDLQRHWQRYIRQQKKLPKQLKLKPEESNNDCRKT